MIVQQVGLITSSFDFAPGATRRQDVAAAEPQFADTVTISAAAREAYEKANKSQELEVDARLDEIKRKHGIFTTLDDMDYLYNHDAKFAAIRDKLQKDPLSLTASEVEYEANALGAMNTMAFLSADEKQLYDKLATEGNGAALGGLCNIAMIRMAFGTHAGAVGGRSYDAVHMGISAENIRRYFSHSIVDSTGTVAAQFDALASYLDQNHNFSMR